MNIAPLLNLNFWLNLAPDPLMPQSVRILELLFCALIFLGVVAKIIASVKKSDYIFALGVKKFAPPFFVMGLLGLLLLLLDFERVSFLSARFWYVVWVLGALVWMIFIIKSLARDLPARQRAIEERRKLQKWLPKKK